MQHPTKKDESGNPRVQYLNPKTVKSGKAGKMGYIPVAVPEKAPDFAKPKTPAKNG